MSNADHLKRVTNFMYPTPWKLARRKRFVAGSHLHRKDKKYFPTRKAARDWLAIKYPGASTREYE